MSDRVKFDPGERRAHLVALGCEQMQGLLFGAAQSEASFGLTAHGAER